MGFAQALDIAVPFAAVMVPGFVLGFGAICLAMHNGFAQIRSEIADVRSEIADLRKELHRLAERVHNLAERVARIEGRLDPYGPGGLADPPLPAGE
ncbi:MAG: hypothetical protein OXI64_08055 [Defluviicoccus sp.]|nr:hypothetical protein [Defluviicoccus sp.]